MLAKCGLLRTEAESPQLSCDCCAHKVNRDDKPAPRLAITTQCRTPGDGFPDCAMHSRIRGCSINSSSSSKRFADCLLDYDQRYAGDVCSQDHGGSSVHDANTTGSLTTTKTLRGSSRYEDLAAEDRGSACTATNRPFAGLWRDLPRAEPAVGRNCRFKHSVIP